MPLTVPATVDLKLMDSTQRQTSIAPTAQTQYVGAPPAAPAKESWLADLGLAAVGIEPNFFTPESKKQRVVVMGVKGHGVDGRGVMLRMKDAAGVKFEKPATCYADVALLDPDSMRSYNWEVLSRPALANLYRVLQRAGPNFSGNLTVDIWTEGRGVNKVFHVVAVEPTDAEGEMSTGAGQARDDDAKEAALVAAVDDHAGE